MGDKNFRAEHLYQFPQALVAECDAHELFREIRAVRAVVVLVKECAGLNCHLPMPEELAAALRGQRSLDDLADL